MHVERGIPLAEVVRPRLNQLFENLRLNRERRKILPLLLALNNEATTMGAWGFGILDSDSALDVYGAYMDLYNIDTPTDDIRQKVEAQFPWAIDDLDDATDFWLALAQAQWECKALDADVASKVQTIVEHDVEKDTWGQEYPKRRIALKRFLTKIRKEKAKPKKRIPPKFFDAPFHKGDCITFRHRRGFYGGVLCLGATAKPERIASNIIAILRIQQVQTPIIEDFLASHILVKSWGEANGREAVFAKSPEPAISVIGVGTVGELRAARSHEVVGNVDVARTFGESVYGFHLNWEWDDHLEFQFDWEDRHPELEIDLSITVKEFIESPADNWGRLGSLFAESQQKTESFDEHKGRCRAFEKQMKSMKLSPEMQLFRFIASYAGASYRRAKNRVDDILRNAR